MLCCYNTHQYKASHKIGEKEPIKFCISKGRAGETAGKILVLFQSSCCLCFFMKASSPVGSTIQPEMEFGFLRFSTPQGTVKDNQGYQLWNSYSSCYIKVKQFQLLQWTSNNNQVLPSNFLLSVQ